MRHYISLQQRREEEEKHNMLCYTRITSMMLLSFFTNVTVTPSVSYYIGVDSNILHYLYQV